MRPSNKFGISNAAHNLSNSVTHGTRATIEKMNKGIMKEEAIIDLSIGTLDAPTDNSIDQGVIDFIKNNSATIHAFAPVKGFPFLLDSIADRVERISNIRYNPESEIMVTPGGIKGSITIIFHTLLNPGDEVIIPIPNWPHYVDMVKLHGAEPKFIRSPDFPFGGLCPSVLDKSITNLTKLVILGDCINPTGKVYSSLELTTFAEIIEKHNQYRKENDLNPIYVLYDCPYEAHILGDRPITFASIDCTINNKKHCSMRNYTLTVTGPGKTYGMHGDRIGYICCPAHILEVAARVQVNLNSFASTYSQVATYYAIQKKMDRIVLERAELARRNLNEMLAILNQIPKITVNNPEGGYFIFVDLSNFASSYIRQGYKRADLFLLSEARVGAISGRYFANESEIANDFDHFLRINCGRSANLLRIAAKRMEVALTRLDC